MKTIGLLGGMSWESSLEYYRIINETVKARLGGLHSAASLMYSFDFAEIEALQMRGDWDGATRMMIAAARRLAAGGAEFIVICTNTMHKMADEVAAAVDLPLLHIADPTAEAIKQQGIDTVGLLGTRFTMEEPFYRGRLQRHHGLKVLTPPPAGRQVVHDIIYEELVLGQINDASRTHYRLIISDMARQGAQGIILGCTEIGLLVGPADSPVPLFDTTRIHAEAAVAFALQDN